MGVASDFQIQEMIHQDEDGVLFQALDKQTGHLVALRRFFLKEEVVAKLKEEGEDGKTVFEAGLEWMRSLEVPHLQDVVGGGFDELDGTPYFVTKWLDGMSLAEAHEKEVFAAGEGEVFEQQARAVLVALPVEARPAVHLEEGEILIGRNEAGSLVTHFFLSPTRYFGAVGGMEFEEEDRNEALRALVENFPAPAAASSAVTLATAPAAASPAPVLKSAQKGGGGGLFWGALVGLAVLLGVGGWLLASGSKKKDETEPVAEVVDEKKAPSPKEEPKEVAVAEEPEVIAPAAPESPERPEESISSAPQTDAEIAAARVEKAQRELAESKKPKTMPKRNPGAYETDTRRPEGEIDLFEDEPEKPTAKKADGLLGPDDLATLKEAEGKAVTFSGTVKESAQSGSGKTWYLDFGDRRSQAFVAFLHTRTPEEESKTDWDAFVGKEIVVQGKVEIDKGQMVRGSGVKIMVTGMSDISLKPEEPKEKVYQYGDLDDLRVVSEGDEIVFEGDFVNFRKKNSFVYLVFEEGFAIAGRFDADGSLANKSFADKLNGLKGERIRLRGTRASDENPKIEIIVHLDASENVTLVD